MSLIDATQLASLQTRMLDALIDTGTVTRTTAPVKDPLGGRSTGGTTTEYSGPCLVETSAPAQLATVGGALAGQITHRIKFPVNVILLPGDIVAVGARRFTVQGMASGSFGLLSIAITLEVTGA